VAFGHPGGGAVNPSPFRPFAGDQRMLAARALLTLLFVATAACNSAEPPTAPDAVPVAPGTPNPGGMGVSASFVRTGYNVSGQATLVIENGVAQLDFSSDFAIAQTPGPFVYLNTSANPNAGQPIRVGALRSRTGAQRYTFQVPAGVRYTHVIIWCDPFNVGMAHAVIPPTP
jgi:hypothetical protein